MSSYSLIVTIGRSCAVFKINGVLVENRKISPPPYITLPLRGFAWNFVTVVALKN